MSMLAGPRRKQKVINLRGNSDWSNDPNKFGQRMLEKMGWSSGKGLGAKENGIVEHVIARYKNDEKGLGYEDKNDQWTKIEDDYNALLASLSGVSDSGKDEILHSGVSLEEKSKKTKTRIHYHKFTRGKDVTRYSAKDLANIFGKKSFKEEAIPEVVTKDVKATEQIFTEKGSMDDYFKSKLAAFNLKGTTDLSASKSEDDFGFQGFTENTEDKDKEEDSHKGFGFQPFSYSESLENNQMIDNSRKGSEKSEIFCTAGTVTRESKPSQNNEAVTAPSYEDKTEAKSKKKKKNKHSVEKDIENVPNVESTDDSPKHDMCSEMKKVKKSKENRYCDKSLDSGAEVTGVSKKLKKHKENYTNFDLEGIDMVELSRSSKKKKRQLKALSKGDQGLEGIVEKDTDILLVDTNGKKKKKLNKGCISDEIVENNKLCYEIEQEQNSDEPAGLSKKLKKKKTSDDLKLNSDEKSYELISSKKKNKKKAVALEDTSSEVFTPKKKKKEKK